MDLVDGFECVCNTSGSVHYTGKTCDKTACEVGEKWFYFLQKQSYADTNYLLKC